MNEILLTEEIYNGITLIKFPGGGLHPGEGTIDCLKREFMEEFKRPLTDVMHFYTTDFYQPSAFNPNQQIISIYYKARLNFTDQTDQLISYDKNVFPFWKNVESVTDKDLTMPIDKKVLSLIKETKWR